MNVEHWWSAAAAADSDALLLGENLVLSVTFSTTNSAWASLDSDSVVRGRLLNTWAMSRPLIVIPVDIMYCVKQRHSLFYILDFLGDRVIK